MKKIIVILLSCMVLAGCTDTSHESETPEGIITSDKLEEIEVNDETNTSEVSYSLRNVNWGMSIQEVVQSEEQEYDYMSEDESSLLYSDVTAGNVKFSYLKYSFDNVALNQATYYADDTHSSDNLYVEDYKTLKDKLTSLYGTPNPDDVKEIWYDDLYKDDPNDYGKAVARGDLTMATRWTTDTSIITLFLSGDNYQCKLAIQYYDINKEIDSNSTDGL